MAIAEAWFVISDPFLCCFEVCVWILSGWKIQTWPIIRFLTGVSHLLIFYMLVLIES